MEVKNKTVCGRPLAGCLRIIETFHGWKAPGLVLGLFMVDKARTLVGKGIEFDAIVETRHCLPDAIQLFTPCTVGNGWLKIIDWDKFALTFYDRHDSRGFRVWLDLEKAYAFPNLYNWYQRLVPKKDLPLAVLLETIINAGDGVLSSAAVNMTRYYQREKKGQTKICPRCGEAYGERQGLVCATCQGKGYYELALPVAGTSKKIRQG